MVVQVLIQEWLWLKTQRLTKNGYVEQKGKLKTWDYGIQQQNSRRLPI